jgi:hypothetical protein
MIYEKEKEKSKKERIRVYLIGVWNQAPCEEGAFCDNH